MYKWNETYPYNGMLFCNAQGWTDTGSNVDESPKSNKVQVTSRKITTYDVIPFVKFYKIENYSDRTH